METGRKSLTSGVNQILLVTFSQEFMKYVQPIIQILLLNYLALLFKSGCSFRHPSMDCVHNNFYIGAHSVTQVGHLFNNTPDSFNASISNNIDNTTYKIDETPK